MICKNCNNTIADNARFCGFCGAQIEAQEPVTVGAASAPVEAPAPASAPVEAPAPASAPVEAPAPASAPVEAPAPASAPVEAPAPASAPVEAPAPASAPVEAPAPANAPAEAPAPASAPVEAPTPVEAPIANAKGGAAVAAKKVPIVPIIVAAAAVILVIAGLLVYFCARPTVMRLFMGKERHAVSTVTDYADELFKTDPVMSVIANNMTSGSNQVVLSGTENIGNVNVSGDITSASAISSISDNASMIASSVSTLSQTDGVTVELSADVSLDKSLKKALGDDEEFVDAVLKLINSAQVTVGAKTDDSTQLSVSAKADGTDLITLNTYTDDSGNTYISIPGILDKPVFVKADDSDKSDEKDEEDDESEDSEDSDESESSDNKKSHNTKDSDDDFVVDNAKLNEVIEQIKKAWADTYKHIELQDEKTEYQVGKGENARTFKGTKITAVLTGEEVSALASQIQEIIDNDEYIAELVEAKGIDIDDFYEDFDNSMDELISIADDEDSSLKLTIESYVTATNKACGVEFTLSYKDDKSEKQNISFSSLSAGGNTEIVLTQNKKKVLNLLSTKTGDNSGTYEIEIQTSADFKDIDYSFKDEIIGIKVEYSNLKKETIFGNDTITGKFEITPNIKSLKDSLSQKTFAVGTDTLESPAKTYDYYTVISKSDLTLETKKKGDGIETTLSADVEKIGSFSVTYAVSAASGEIASAPADTANVYNGNELKGVDNIDISLKSLNYAKDKIKENKNVAAVAEKFGYTEEIIDAQIAEFEKNRTFYEHYSAFNPETSCTDAYNMAYYLNEDFLYSDNAMPSSERRGKTFTLKVWFDKDGKLTVIDPDGVSYDWAKVFRADTYKNLYAEFCVNSGSVMGVCTVLTDDPATLPSKLPGYFNYNDYVFEFDEKPSFYSGGYKDNFVVGSYPELSVGESTTEAKVKKAVDLVSDYNEYAESISNAFNEFISDHRATIKQSYYGYYQLNVSDNGTWDDDSYWSQLEYMFTEDLSSYEKQLYKKLGAAASDLKSAYVRIYISNQAVVGVSVSNSYYNAVNLMDFNLGSTSAWTYADGVYRDWNDYYTIGTYPVLSTADTATKIDKALDLMTGTWRIDYSTEDRSIENSIVTLKKDDLSALVPSDATISSESYYLYIYDSNYDPIFCLGYNYNGYYTLTYYTDYRYYEYISYSRDLSY